VAVWEVRSIAGLEAVSEPRGASCQLAISAGKQAPKLAASATVQVLKQLLSRMGTAVGSRPASRLALGVRFARDCSVIDATCAVTRWMSTANKGTVMFPGNANRLTFRSTTGRGRLFFRGICRDESGSVEACAYILMTSIVGIGMIVGLASYRNGITQSLGDIADAMQGVNQSFTVHMTFAQIGGGTTTKSFGYVDTQPPPPTPGQAPAGMDLVVPASSEQ
jgi:hypothetical protein